MNKHALLLVSCAAVGGFVLYKRISNAKTQALVAGVAGRVPASTGNPGTANKTAMTAGGQSNTAGMSRINVAAGSKSGGSLSDAAAVGSIAASAGDLWNSIGDWFSSGDSSTPDYTSGDMETASFDFESDEGDDLSQSYDDSWSNSYSDVA